MNELTEDELRAEFHNQTALAAWEDLQPHYARGSVILVDSSIDLVEVALQMRLDNSGQFQNWIATGAVAGISDEQGLSFAETETRLWAVVVPPWVLVQVPA